MVGDINTEQPKRHKYGAKKTWCADDLHLHDSQKEAQKCGSLRTALELGEITDLEYQPEYRVEIAGKLICRYVADFRYRMADSGLPIILDVKGMTTPAFNLKRKLVEATHPGVVITLWPPKKRKARKKVAK